MCSLSQALKVGFMNSCIIGHRQNDAYLVLGGGAPCRDFRNGSWCKTSLILSVVKALGSIYSFTSEQNGAGGVHNVQ